MSKKYDFQKIEKKWQKAWEEEGVYVADDKSRKEKKYVLIEFPYPSGEGLHMGHLRPYVAADVYGRFMRMSGYETMFPMGWDAFGLPAENYAIKKGIHPSISTAKNVENAKAQVKSWGISFDWSREINTTDPAYYKWTQWIFLQLFKAGLAYEATGLINWCPKDKTGLANEEVINGACERCGAKVEQKELRQWYLKITAYAEKLLEGLKNLNWPDPIKIQQENWIGKSEGAEIKFELSVPGQPKGAHSVEVFTTRSDTLFGATFIVVAPEVAQKWLSVGWNASDQVKKYVKEALANRLKEDDGVEKEKTGVFSEVYAINPANKEEIPVWVADYVLAGYGTGAIMAVPAHDERDYEFAKKFKLRVVCVIAPEDVDEKAKKAILEGEMFYVGSGTLINSGKFDGMDSETAKWEITKFVDGKKKTQYRLRDWVFSRQRYWGEPIPLVHCGKCGIVPVPEKDLPVALPDVKNYEPTGTGESPLAVIDPWVNTECPECGGPGKRETNTMPQWAGSSWYYLRYCDPNNKEEFADAKLLKRWLPVDVYFGGMEHTTLHLLYSRFWHQFLYDQKFVPTPEPYARRVPHGIILGPDGDKMSKSKGNIVNPDEIVGKFGADSLRMYELFLGPHEGTVSWNNQGILGISRFLERVHKVFAEAEGQEDERVKRALHKAVKKVGEDIQAFKFNTAVSAFMIFLNETEGNALEHSVRESFVKILAPFAPHLAEELWRYALGTKTSIHLEPWPEYDPKLISDATFTLVIQVNGKIRDSVEAPAGIGKEEAEALAFGREKIKTVLGSKEPQKVIYVPGRLVNIITGN